jgi:tetratricopeptide (TPR) repeat protein
VYQRKLSDIFMVQDEIANNIVDQISLELGDGVAPLPHSMPTVEFMRAHPPSNLEAYDLYLKGVQMVTSNRPALIEQATGYFDRAIALDRDYADAWAAKGYALAILGSHGSGSSRIPASVYPDAIAALRRALEIDPGHAFATGWLGVGLMLNDFKWAEGMQLLKESIALNPNDAALLAVYGFYTDIMQLEGAHEVLERAYRLDPFGFGPILDRAVHLQREGRLLDAAALIETGLIEDREGYAPNYFSAVFNLRLGRLDVAEERIRKARLVAKPVDLNLDALAWLIDSRRGRGPLPLEEIWERMQKEKLSGVVLHDEWEDEEAIVAVFDLAIKQRHPALRSAVFGPKPPMMPEADWRRILEITGVTQFQHSDFYNKQKSGRSGTYR